MNKLVLPFLFLVCSASSCSNGQQQKGEQEETSIATEPAKHSIDLSEHDLPLILEIDPNMLAADTVAVEWNEEFGHLEVTVGPKFSITIIEGEPEMERLKASLNNDPLRTTTIIEEKPDLIIYRSQFPDDDLVFTHFYQVVRAGDRTFVVESNDQGHFNEQDVRRMVGAVLPRQQA